VPLFSLKKMLETAIFCTSTDLKRNVIRRSSSTRVRNTTCDMEGSDEKDSRSQLSRMRRSHA